MGDIEIPDNLELYDTIVLNGLIGYCKTHDDNDETIGVKVIQRVRRLNGEEKDVIIDSFPFTVEMADRCEWGKSYASVQMLTGLTPIDMDHIDETKIVSMEGEVDSQYYHRYSSYTGYLGTEEEWKCGGHSIPGILLNHIGEYVHMEIELYKKSLKRSHKRAVLFTL